ncbi:hypothetical protein EVAR_66252_1 [Eumeta japonica]|uniref:Uncharacterized protein n=1 Tax=Eumeta variegata TaxID=151549 RepID=A0A4C1ZVP8_EUMVA|nr:hypothetical protein EVAR_66252_1 [Eumeta japonica]
MTTDDLRPLPEPQFTEWVTRRYMPHRQHTDFTVSTFSPSDCRRTSANIERIPRADNAPRERCASAAPPVERSSRSAICEIVAFCNFNFIYKPPPASRS